MTLLVPPPPRAAAVKCGPRILLGFRWLPEAIGREASDDQRNRAEAANQQCKTQPYAGLLSYESDRRWKEHAAHLRDGE